jgi:hypothetical protein
MPFVWTYLVGRELTPADMFSSDPGYFRWLREIREFSGSEEEFSKLELTYVVSDCAGKSVELVPGGSNVYVAFADRLVYCSLCEEFRCKEFDGPLEAMLEGFSIFFSKSMRRLLSPWELEVFVCGDMTVPVEELKRHCRIDQADIPQIGMLWRVLERFTPEERMMFIKFATGRMGLPPPGMKWNHILCIRFDVSLTHTGKIDSRLPVASTCSSTISIPLYSSEEIMEKRLRAAIWYGCDIERDRDLEAHELVGLA